jgi:hypothetical protein
VAGNVPVIGIEGLLALAGMIAGLRAGGGEGGGPRCQLMLRCPPVSVCRSKIGFWL